MALAHEISVNQNFKLEKLEFETNRYKSISLFLNVGFFYLKIRLYLSIEKQIKETVHKAFWDMLKQDFEKDPVEYEHSFIILNEAKQVIRGFD